MKLVEMSISAGVLILFLVLLRTICFSKLPRRALVLLWIIALVRLLLPFSLPIKKGIATPVLGLIEKILPMLKQNLFSGNTGAALDTVHKAAYGVSGEGWRGYLQNMLAGDFCSALYAVWIAGAAGFGIYFFYSYRKENQMLAQAIPLKNMQTDYKAPGDLLKLYDNARNLAGRKQLKINTRYEKVYIHDRIQSPLVWGMLRQRIVFPKSLCCLEQSKIQYMLTHEYIHMKRHDNLWKLVSAAVVCIHWFNPFVWVMYFLLARDLELSCDEYVLSLYGAASKEEYAMTLLSLMQNQKGTTLFCSGFGKNPAKERITAIMNYKNITKAGVFSAVLLLAGAATVFAANDRAAASETETLKAGNAESNKPAYCTVTATNENGEIIQDSKIVEIESDGKSEKIVLSVFGEGDEELFGEHEKLYYMDLEGIVYTCDETEDSSQAPDTTLTYNGKKYELRPVNKDTDKKTDQ